MSSRLKIIKEWVDLNITAANSTVKDKFEVDKHVTKIIGIAITSNQDGELYHRGSVKISINEKEIYPEDYETKMLVQGTNVPVNDRIIRFAENEEVEPGNRKVEIEYTDKDHSAAPFSAYRVRLYIFSRIDS